MDPVLSESPPWSTARRTPSWKSRTTSAQYRPMARASSATQPWAGAGASLRSSIQTRVTRGKLGFETEIVSGPESVARTRALISGLEARGIRISDTSRLRRYLEAEQRLEAEGPPTTTEGKRRLLIAKLETSLLSTAFEYLSKDPPLPGVIELLRKAAHGTEFPTEGEDRPRDYQAEAWFAGLLRRAGEAISLSEPDIVIHHAGRQFGIPVKRPRTWKSLKGRLHSAVRQLRGARLTGFLFIDFTILLDLHRWPAPASFEEFRRRSDEIEPELRRLASKGDVVRWLGECYKGDRLAGIIAAAHVAGTAEDGRTFFLSRRLIGSLLPNHRARHAAEYLRSLFP